MCKNSVGTTGTSCLWFGWGCFSDIFFKCTSIHSRHWWMVWTFPFTPSHMARSKNQPRALNRMRIANRATTSDSPRRSLESSISLPKLLPVPSSWFHCCHGMQNPPLIQAHRHHFPRWVVWHFYFLIHDSCPPQATTHTLPVSSPVEWPLFLPVICID